MKDYSSQIQNKTETYFHFRQLMDSPLWIQRLLNPNLSIQYPESTMLIISLLYRIT